MLEQHLDRMPPIVVIQATIWWETVLALVKIQESGLEVHLPVKVCGDLIPSICAYAQETHQYIIGPCILSRHAC